MGEEQKKSEEQPKAEEKTPEEPQKNEEEAKSAAEADNSIQEEKPEEFKPEEVAPPPPPTEIMLKVFMHCEGCARKVRRCLKGFPGVEKVVTDCKSHMVVVKGEKADPLKVLERVQAKSHRKVELLSPIPQPQEENKAQEEEKSKPEPKPEEKKEEPPIVTVLKIHMHCEACAQEVKRRIEKMKGVESAEPDLKNSQVSVKGRYEPSKLVEYVYKRSGKHAVIIKQQQEEGEKKEKAEEEKKEEEKESDDAAAAEEKKEEEKGEEGVKEETKGEGEGEAEAEAKVEEAAAEETASGEEVVKINEYHYNPQTYGMEVYAQPPPAIAAAQYPAYYQYYHAYPPQIFSDENPNACTIM